MLSYSVIALFLCLAVVDSSQLLSLLDKTAGVYKDSSRSVGELKKTVLLTASSHGFINQLLNFKCFAERLAMKFLVVSMDKRTHDYITNNTTMTSFLFAAADDSHIAGSPKFRSSGARKMEAVQRILSLKYNVIFSDTDVALVGDPVPYLLWENVDFVHTLDFMCTLDQNWDFRTSKVEGNTGFYFVRSTPATIKFWQSVYQASPRYPKMDDQFVFWKLIRKNLDPPMLPLPKCRHFNTPDDIQSRYNKTGGQYLVSCFLDTCSFSSGMLSGVKSGYEYKNLLSNLRVLNQTMVAVHGNYLSGAEQKRKHMKEYGFWLSESVVTTSDKKTLHVEDRGCRAFVPAALPAKQKVEWTDGQVQTVFHEYPTSIPEITIREDDHTGLPVVTGKAHLLTRKVPLAEFKRHMQCLRMEPNFDFNGGSVGLIKMIPPTREIAELMCAYADTKCDHWLRCQRIVASLNAAKASTRKGGMFDQVGMLRIINNELYYDWPWSVERFSKWDNEIIKLIWVVMSAISDLRDNVFFAGGEQAALPYNFPFPTFSSAPKMGSSDMPWPWVEMWRASQQHYYKLIEKGLDPNDETQYHSIIEGYRKWEDRVPKAAFFSGVDENKVVLLDAARLNPDLLDYAAKYKRCVRPYHPLSPEDCVDAETAKLLNSQNLTHLPAGYSGPYHNFSRTPHFPGSYKYVVVPMGLHGTSTTGRLGPLLATSGAVVMMPRMPFVYHISAQLKPWVHYVPLSYSGTDVVEKIRWLRDHDDLARQIARNGRLFARSYLRLEDYYCYAANAMELVGELEKNSNVTVPFNPMKVKIKLPPELRQILNN